MNPQLHLAFEGAMRAARLCYQDGAYDDAFAHLETAHVLGQRYILPHIHAHWWMLKIGLKRKSGVEVWGQAVRIVLGALGSAVGIVPTGNTGGANISMFARKPIDPAIAALLGDKTDRP